MITAGGLAGPANSGGLVVHVLGSGSGWPTAQRDTCSLLLGDRIGWSLVECPGSIVHKLARIGVSLGQLHRVILTHNHVDHIYGLPHLIQAMAIAGAPSSLELWAPVQTLETVRNIVRTYGLDSERHPSLEMREIRLQAGESIRLADTAFVAAPAAHSRETAALRFGTDDAAVCFSSDTRPCDDVTSLSRGVDLLLHDCGGPHQMREAFQQGHSSALQAAQVASAAGAQRLVLMHLGSRTDEQLAECLREAQGAFERQVTLAEDGATWSLPGPTEGAGQTGEVPGE